MKKSIIALAALTVACAAFAQMDQAILSSSQITTNVGTASEIVKGEIFGIRLETTANKTNGVAITTAEGETVLAVSALTADQTYFPLVGAHASATGAALTAVDAGGNTNAVYIQQAVSSLLTLTVTPAADTTGTNTVKAIVTFRK